TLIQSETLALLEWPRLCQQVAEFAKMLWVSSALIPNASYNSRAAVASAGSPRFCPPPGREKDGASFYLRAFPEWDFLETGYSPLGNGTEIRQAYFEGASERYEPQIPPGVAQFLRKFRAYPRYASLREEYHFLQGYRQA
ncbi:MAG: hypothetical protein VKN60_03125, partial [Cyanobacteriota bacterium]|nr:hypothetical protein [Cyanobacteriota bacterium]